ncbi:hypothetical protein SEA_BOCK_55 [Gordonia phage Bock]|nr:hypothetical protein SEA_BOCK_55 [Gordonia phage Bock]
MSSPAKRLRAILLPFLETRWLVVHSGRVDEDVPIHRGETHLVADVSFQSVDVLFDPAGDPKAPRHMAIVLRVVLLRWWWWVVVRVCDETAELGDWDE